MFIYLLVCWYFLTVEHKNVLNMVDMFAVKSLGRNRKQSPFSVSDPFFYIQSFTSCFILLLAKNNSYKTSELNSVRKKTAI